ncbi:hypothetical protein [Methylocella silvestris]|uniref:hypothetical protein n=1 Tax=Methylocella silvestris TaxID=199596 RepID=UPI001650663A|nr:hypothetical protein [Methylocella silvestris]
MERLARGHCAEFVVVSARSYLVLPSGGVDPDAVATAHFVPDFRHDVAGAGFVERVAFLDSVSRRKLMHEAGFEKLKLGQGLVQHRRREPVDDGAFFQIFSGGLFVDQSGLEVQGNHVFGAFYRNAADSKQRLQRFRAEIEQRCALRAGAFQRSPRIKQAEEQQLKIGASNEWPIIGNGSIDRDDCCIKRIFAARDSAKRLVYGLNLNVHDFRLCLTRSRGERRGN